MGANNAIGQLVVRIVMVLISVSFLASCTPGGCSRREPTTIATSMWPALWTNPPIYLDTHPTLRKFVRKLTRHRTTPVDIPPTDPKARITSTNVAVQLPSGGLTGNSVNIYPSTLSGDAHWTVVNTPVNSGVTTREGFELIRGDHWYLSTAPSSQ